MVHIQAVFKKLCERMNVKVKIIYYIYVLWLLFVIVGVATVATLALRGGLWWGGYRAAVAAVGAESCAS